jgi:hypothetical protein
MGGDANVGFRRAGAPLAWAVVCCIVLGAQSRDSKMYLGVDSIHAGDMCLILGGTAESGDFFKGLQKRETRHGESFKNARGQKVTSFPARLTVKIDAGLDKCAGQGTPSCDRCDLPLSTELMNSLQFDAYWKQGFEMQKADIDVLSVERPNYLLPTAPNAELWKFEISIRSKNIPLTDSLIVVLHTPDGKIVSRLSGKP